MRKKKRWGGENDKCEKCGRNEDRPIETIEHLLTECCAYEEERNKFNERMENNIGKDNWSRLKTDDDKGLKTMLGLQGDRKEIIIEDTKKYLREI